MHAKLETTLIPITPIERDGEHWLQIRIPNGWSDVLPFHLAQHGQAQDQRKLRKAQSG